MMLRIMVGPGIREFAEERVGGANFRQGAQLALGLLRQSALITATGALRGSSTE